MESTLWFLLHSSCFNGGRLAAANISHSSALCEHPQSIRTPHLRIRLYLSGSWHHQACFVTAESDTQDTWRCLTYIRSIERTSSESKAYIRLVPRLNATWERSMLLKKPRFSRRTQRSSMSMDITAGCLHIYLRICQRIRSSLHLSAWRIAHLIAYADATSKQLKTLPRRNHFAQAALSRFRDRLESNSVAAAAAVAALASLRPLLRRRRRRRRRLSLSSSVDPPGENGNLTARTRRLPGN